MWKFSFNKATESSAFNLAGTGNIQVVQGVKSQNDNTIWKYQFQRQVGIVALAGQSPQRKDIGLALDITV